MVCYISKFCRVCECIPILTEQRFQHWTTQISTISLNIPTGTNSTFHGYLRVISPCCSDIWGIWLHWATLISGSWREYNSINKRKTTYKLCLLCLGRTSCFFWFFLSEIAIQRLKRKKIKPLINGFIPWSKELIKNPKNVTFLLELGINALSIFHIKYSFHIDESAWSAIYAMEINRTHQYLCITLIF